ncbi:hypothetical protein IPC451_02060 [Pseudomonas aeruginosa]|uniref:hypothetical protein n=1 Tax=Pseudomonas aeruginosa TaxID=287 RepID=UPI000F878428|nr:hypothetical protein [Pseudomonas aeruginosa]RUI01795.1 hypothetical protein IPC451_02060 [Pseudomonas aeruginosa]
MTERQDAQPKPKGLKNMNQIAERILLPLQRLQHEHDKIAHQDILSFSLHKRLKHMVLHFYKYAGKIQIAWEDNDLQTFRKSLIDSFIICMASANAMNLSLGKVMPAELVASDLDGLAAAISEGLSVQDLYASSIRDFLIIGGKMAKALESADHMEDGNPRGEMRVLLPDLTISVLGHLGKLDGELEEEIRSRLLSVEQKSILI